MKLFKRLLCMVIFVAVCGVAFFWYAKRQYTLSYNLSESQEILIKRGAGLNQVASVLVSHHIVDNPYWFIFYARFYGLENKLKAGEYAFSGDISYAKVLNKLAKGEVIVRSVTIPEGKALVEIKQILMSNPYLSGEIKGVYREGEILPETYHFTRGESRDSILIKARQAMKNELQKAFDERDADLPLKTAEELLVLASIVEKETGLAEERAKVASVFVNRLRLGMKLQTDPTVIYAVTHGQMNLNRPIYKRDLGYDSPYNTYVYEGLPPAPICSPGKAALLAVAHPDKTPYLYFVADGQTGGHRFGRTLSEHNENVALYRKAR
jgi:UPF0755 protein